LRVCELEKEKRSLLEDEEGCLGDSKVELYGWKKEIKNS
jgi:hypothetical protein